MHLCLATIPACVALACILGVEVPHLFAVDVNTN